MPIADITNKITEDALKEAENIAAGGELKSKEIKEATEKLKSEIAETQKNVLEKNLSENERRVVSAANQEVKLKIDKSKREAVDETFSMALSRLLSLSDDEYETLLVKLIGSLDKNMDGEVAAPKERVGITKKILKKLKMGYPVKSTDKFKGGIIFTGDNFEYNFTFENILRDKKGSLEAELSNLLFS